MAQEATGRRTAVRAVAWAFLLATLAGAACAGKPRLHPYISRDDTATTLRLIDEGSDVNAADKAKAWTPLMFAAQSGNVRVARKLLDNGADPDRQSTDGVTAMYIAAGQGQDGVVALLLERGVDPDPVPDHGPVVGATPISAAAHGGHPSTVRMLAEAGADVDSHDGDGWTPLMGAAWAGSRQTVEYLVSKGADPKARNNVGSTALDLAVQKGRADVVSYFRPPPSPSPPPLPPLEEVVQLGNQEALTRALEVWTANPDEAARALVLAIRRIVSLQLVTDLDGIRLVVQGEGLSGPSFDALGMGTDKLVRVSPEERAALLAIVARLLQLGADPNRYHLEGYAPATSTPLVGSRGVSRLSSGSPGTLVPRGEGTLSALGLARLEGDPEVSGLLERHGAQ